MDVSLREVNYHRESLPSQIPPPLVSALSRDDPDALARKSRGRFYITPDDAHRNGAAEFHLATRLALHSARSLGPLGPPWSPWGPVSLDGPD